MTLVAKGGPVGGLIGIDHEVPVAPFMPVMMFAILFGLSMDYEVFLISRIREEYLKDGDTRRAVADGLAKTARVITAAAAIMVVVFLAFLAAPDVFLKLFGIGLASAIFLDATVVRMVLVPAVMQLLGSRNWWIPDWLERILPRLDVEPVRGRRRRRGGRRRHLIAGLRSHRLGPKRDRFLPSPKASAEPGAFFRESVLDVPCDNSAHAVAKLCPACRVSGVRGDRLKRFQLGPSFHPRLQEERCASVSVRQGLPPCGHIRGRRSDGSSPRDGGRHADQALRQAGEPRQGAVSG